MVFRDSRLASALTLAAGIAVCDGIAAATGLPVEIKWPNDVVREDAGRRRKIAGVLAEASTRAAALEYVVLGIGVNLLRAAYPPEFEERATSIEAELGRPPDRSRLLEAIVCGLQAEASRLRAGDTRTTLARWKTLAPSAVGAPVQWTGAAGVTRGTTAGIDTDGALLVDVGGRTERIVSGELRWS
jgi:BirA family biotin operon repressor/biotin-[acetyl-CoA-carboxylase] ligase